MAVMAIHDGLDRHVGQDLEPQLLDDHECFVPAVARGPKTPSSNIRTTVIEVKFGGFGAGVSGAITAYLFSYSDYQTFDSSVSILALAIVILGGLGDVAGAQHRHRHRDPDAICRPASTPAGRSCPKRHTEPGAKPHVIEPISDISSVEQSIRRGAARAGREKLMLAPVESSSARRLPGAT